MANILYAQEKVWINPEGLLVPDGDSTATLLLAARGRRMTIVELEEFPNALDFFGEDQPAATPMFRYMVAVPGAKLPEQEESPIVVAAREARESAESNQSEAKPKAKPKK